MNKPAIIVLNDKPDGLDGLERALDRDCASSPPWIRGKEIFIIAS